MSVKYCALLFACTWVGTVMGAANDSETLYAAIRANDLPRLEALLKQGASPNAKDEHGITALMQAAAVGSADAMQVLIDKGADVNAANMFGSTALMWSATDIRKVRLLLEHNAGVNAASKQGRTALLVAALSDGSAGIVRLLIAHGANTHVKDAFGVTALTAAAAGNDAETVKLLLDSADVNAASGTQAAIADLEETPLLAASFNGNLAVARMLLAKGANVNEASSRDKLFQVKNGPIMLGAFTPLLMASAFGPPELVKALLDAGADVNAKDARGMTPLMLAVATDRQSPEIIRSLLDKGADVKAKSNLGETALDWARKIGRAPALDMLQRAGAVASAAQVVPVSAPAPVDLKPAVERSVALMERISGDFFAKGGCVSCHAQNLTELAVSTARAKGIAVNEKAAQERVQIVKAIYGPAAPMLLERLDPPGAMDTSGYSAVALAASGYPPDHMTDAMAVNIAAQQAGDGRWHYGGLARPPFEDGDIFRTALCIRVLSAYGPPGRGAEMRERIARARRWLLAAKPATAEDRNMQLLGLHWAGADSATLHKLAAAILANQWADGGWSQRAALESDAYATGESLYALGAAGGVAPGDPAYQKGVKYLLATQRADGSWHVRSSAPKFQPYFESGFPYGNDQWISAAATGWATMGLSLALGEPPAKSRTAE